ncbi:MAG: site-2 protease family protein [Deltaproteobacteria bacterium]|nr:site-2 protease family protein [Deltaproteobacteria bacterium]
MKSIWAQSIWAHTLLFVASFATTWWYGGPYFAGTLMGILLCHEAGHYIVGRMRGVDASLPYFIPLPPQISFGTLGAVIRMKSPITDRNALFDVGAAGPVAGLIVAIPLLVIGLHLSEVGPVLPDTAIEGNSILYAVIKYIVFGRWLPGDGVDVQLHPMALAAWVGLLVTAINLMPIGQLDGGHVARAALGERHERLSQRLNIALPAVGIAVGSIMLVSAFGAGKDLFAALSYASYGAIPWCMWAVLLGFMRRQAGEYHPPVSEELLDPRRRLQAIGMLVLFVLIVTPVPMRPVL